MTYLSRSLIRQMILAEARKKLNTDFDFSDSTTQVVDIDKDTKIKEVPSSLSSLYDDEDEMTFDDKTEQGFGVSGIDDFEESEEESESETEDNPLPMAAYHEKFRLQPDMQSSVDPFERTYGEIRQDVFDSYDELYKPPTKKSEAQKEAEFLKKMEDMIAQGRSATEFPDDPEFGSSDTLELPDRLRINLADEDTKDLNETITRLVKKSIRQKIKRRSKFNRF